MVASNVDPAEADLTPIDPEGNRRRRDRRRRPAATAAQPNGVPLTPEAQEKNQRLWWYLLVAGILLLGADTLMSNRLAKT